jgi:competence protein ComEC
MALVRHPAALEDDCRSADIVIAPFTIGKRCRAARVIIDRRMLRAQGAYALYLEGLSIRAEGADRAVVKTAPPRPVQGNDAAETDQRSGSNPEE